MSFVFRALEGKIITIVLLFGSAMQVSHFKDIRDF